jgi:hypothetical protein
MLGIREEKDNAETLRTLRYAEKSRLLVGNN